MGESGSGRWLLVEPAVQGFAPSSLAFTAGKGVLESGQSFRLINIDSHIALDTQDAGTTGHIFLEPAKGHRQAFFGHQLRHREQHAKSGTTEVFDLGQV